MKITVYWILTVSLLCGCASQSYRKTASHEYADDAWDGSADYAMMESMPSSPAESLSLSRSHASQKEMERISDDDAGGAPGSGDHLYPTASPEPSTPDTGAPALTPDDPLIVYTGYLKLRVRNILETVEAISKQTEAHGGYVESLSGNVITVRIPGAGFDDRMDAFATLGDLLDRVIRAMEVTGQFTDLRARLQVAREARDRLVALLEKTAKVKDRLQILEEIKRLSERIEEITSTLSTLQNLIDYFTITIEMIPVLADDRTTTHQSPFEWIRRLSAHRTTLFKGARALTMKLPPAFVLFSEDKDYRAQAADTTTLRGGTIENEPAGTATFWMDAVQFEMAGRGEILQDSGTIGDLEYRVYRNDDVAPRWYLIAARVSKKKVYVVEVFYPDADAFEAHHESVLTSLGTLEVK